MAAITPVCRTDTLACPLNAGKLGQVRDLIQHLRHIAEREARHQWARFFQSRWDRFETMAKKGWTRPWVQDQALSTTLAQMIMAQVGASLKGHWGNVRNTYRDLVAGSTLPPLVRHQLYSINVRGLWFTPSPVTLEQQLPDPVEPDRLKKTTVVIPEDVRALARGLIRRALARHRRPNFRQFQFQLDQRASWIQRAHTAKHSDWLMLSLGDGQSKLPLTIQVHEAFLERNTHARFWQALDPHHVHPGQAPAPRQCSGAAFLVDMQAMEKQAANDRNPHLSRFAIPNTVRFLLDEDGKGLRIGVVSNMGPAFEHQAATYTPISPGKTLCLDVGLKTLLATDDGELHGRNWMDKLIGLDRTIQAIARHRQRLGLKLTDIRRYREATRRLKGFLKTEINRILNRLVQRKKPAILVLERLDFQGSGLSRRLNRLLANFGKGILTAKLKELEAQWGIVTEYRYAPYSSQECHSCGYIDVRNRKSQAQFQGKFCNLTQHADIQTSRTLPHRRSVSTGVSHPADRRSFLMERVRVFNQRHTRPRGGPADPRHTNPYFKEWVAEVRSSAGDGSCPGRSSVSIHLE